MRGDVLQEMRRQFEECGCDLDRQYARYGRTPYFFADVIEPGRVYEIGYPRCLCPQVAAGFTDAPTHCECSRESILFVLQDLLRSRQTKTGGSLEENLRFFVVSPFPGGFPSPPCNLHAPDSARGRRLSLRKKTAADEAARSSYPTSTRKRHSGQPDRTVPRHSTRVPGAAHAMSYRDNPEEYTRRVGEFVGRYIGTQGGEDDGAGA